MLVTMKQTDVLETLTTSYVVISQMKCLNHLRILDPESTKLMQWKHPQISILY